jgi:soluble cytochrome b562
MLISSSQAAASQEAAQSLAKSSNELTCYKFSSEIEFRDYLSGMQRWIYLDTLELMHKVFREKTIASKTTLLQTIRATYLAKDRFNEHEQDRLADMLTEIKRESTLT